MLIIKTPDNRSLRAIAKRLAAGAVVVYPTDTAYGLGCDATNAKAVANIFKIKGRDAKNALPIVAADLKMVKKFFLFTARHSPLAEYWPGPLSVVIQAKRGIAKKALKKGTAAVRVPNSDIARKLSALLGRPLVATSANISGRPACYSASAFVKQAKDMAIKPDLVIDVGALPRRKPSTIVKITESGELEILRQGPIKLR